MRDQQPVTISFEKIAVTGSDTDGPWIASSRLESGRRGVEMRTLLSPGLLFLEVRSQDGKHSSSTMEQGNACQSLCNVIDDSIARPEGLGIESSHGGCLRVNRWTMKRR